MLLWIGRYLIVAGDSVLIVAGGLVQLDQVPGVGLSLPDSHGSNHQVWVLKLLVDDEQGGDVVMVGGLVLFEMQIKVVG